MSKSCKQKHYTTYTLQHHFIFLGLSSFAANPASLLIQNHQLVSAGYIMSSPHSSESTRVSSAERFQGSSSSSHGGMVTQWLEAVDLAAATSTTPSQNTFTISIAPRETVPRSPVTAAVFQTYAQPVQDFFSIPTPHLPVGRSAQAPTLQYPPPLRFTHAALPSVFDSYDTTPSSSALPSPSSAQQVRCASVPIRERLADIDTSLCAWRRFTDQFEDRVSTEDILEGGYVQPYSAPARIDGGGGVAQGVFAAGVTAQRTLGDIPPSDTDALRNFWAEIEAEERSQGSQWAYLGVALGGTGPVSGGVLEGGEEREYSNDLVNELNSRLEYPDITQTSVFPFAWSDVSSSSGSSLSSGSPGLSDWGTPTVRPPVQPLIGGPPAAMIGDLNPFSQVEGDEELAQEHYAHPFHRFPVFNDSFNLPTTWEDTLAPFVFPAAPPGEIPSIFAPGSSSHIHPLPGPVPGGFAHGIYPPPQSPELENWMGESLGGYSSLASVSVSHSTSYPPSSTVPDSPGIPWDPADAGTAACPVCYDHKITREFPCSVQDAQHGLCPPCWTEYESYYTDIVRCPLCRHEFFESQVVATHSSGPERQEEEGVDSDAHKVEESEEDGDYEVEDEDEIVFFVGVFGA
ncbi:hypothetical protein L873DRAFT_1100237 [Choiromyces venosus 120613-1]|uniref:RING-type domain-containing protein n=1 Tax=Choiromyces venosus 120613-1 TaxID=1336337 RepID=A0A3N4JH99_9PEZI|nr:hypothetical protein L873DRAFT_1100237 [Choiromyces venosus 120613-1]